MTREFCCGEEGTGTELDGGQCSAQELNHQESEHVTQSQSVEQEPTAEPSVPISVVCNY